jgi:hypothetical protein
MTLHARDHRSADDARALALQEGATHDCHVAFDTVTYYRTTAAGRVEVATASAVGGVWTLSTWIPRVLSLLPRAATRIEDTHVE